MKTVFTILFLSFFSFFSFSQNQCDSVIKIAELELLKVKKNIISLETEQNISDVKLGTEMVMSKFYDGENLDLNLKGWVIIAKVSFVAEDKGKVTVKVKKELSGVKLKDAFKKGEKDVKVQLKYKALATEEPYLKKNESDTIIVGTLMCDLKQGEWRSFYEGNKIQTIVHYKNDEKNGEYEIFYENGNLKDKGTYREDKAVGVISFYNEDGSIEKEVNYVNGKQDGVEKGYWNDSVVKYEQRYRNGVLCCTSREYYETGELKLEIVYEDG